MDIWRWVGEAEEALRKDGHGRLANLLQRIPSYVCDDDHGRVDGVMPEALALTRVAKAPWLEIFLRHWHLQSRVLHRMQARDSLTDAVTLVEMASRDENRGCPQSVCATQDLTACYGAMDGPGYALDRLRVASESLERIDPDWPCFSCISMEYVSALQDTGKPQEALDFLDGQLAQLRDSGDRFRQEVHMAPQRAELLVELDRAEEALALCDATEPKLRDQHQTHRVQLLRVAALALLGRGEEAGERLLPREVVMPTMRLYELWLRCVKLLALSGVLRNDWRIDAAMAEMQRAMTANGVVRQALETALRRGKLALARGRLATASSCADEAEPLLGGLHAPCGAPEQLSELRAAIAAARAAANDPAQEELATPQALLAALGDDPEENLELLEAARARWPEHEDLRLATVAALGAMRRHEQALSLTHEPGPNMRAAAFTLRVQLLQALNRHDEALAMAEQIGTSPADDEVACQALWVAAQIHQERGDLGAARARLEAVLERTPAALNTRMLLAQVLLAQDEPEGALAVLDRLVADAETPGPWDWDRMVVGTLLGRWDAVRASADRVGFALEGEGPVDVPMGYVKLRFREADGTHTDLICERIGPVTARVVQMTAPVAGPFRYDDRVVFDAAPLQRTEEGELPVFSPVRTLASGGYRVFTIDGLNPGPEALAVVEEALGAGLGALQVASGDGYRLRVPGEDETRRVPGLYAFLAVSPEAALDDVDSFLSRVSSGWPHPWLWPTLLEAAGRPEEAATQRARANDYGIKLDE